MAPMNFAEIPAAIEESGRPERNAGGMTFTDSFVEVDGCKTHLRRGGSGAPLLFLHGASGAPVDHAVHGEARAALRRAGARASRATGKSDEPEWLENIHDWRISIWISEETRPFGLTVVGSSMGGWIAMEMAVRDTSRLKSLVLVSPAGIARPACSRPTSSSWRQEELRQEPVLRRKARAGAPRAAPRTSTSRSRTATPPRASPGSRGCTILSCRSGCTASTCR